MEGFQIELHLVAAPLREEPEAPAKEVERVEPPEPEPDVRDFRNNSFCISPDIGDIRLTAYVREHTNTSKRCALLPRLSRLVSLAASYRILVAKAIFVFILQSGAQHLHFE